jgi:hypothetical protein
MLYSSEILKASLHGNFLSFAFSNKLSVSFIISSCTERSFKDMVYPFLDKKLVPILYIFSIV